MTLHGKIEADVEIKASADKFHDIFGFRPHHTSNCSPNKIHGVDLHEGDWGKEGSTICWRYFHDGKLRVAKEIIEKIDHENNATTFRVIEGDLMEIYKSFVLTVQATPKGEGCVVHWTIEYERLHDGVDHPESLVQFVVEVTKDVETHLIEPEGESKQGHADPSNVTPE